MNVRHVRALLQKNMILAFRGLDPFIDFFYWTFYDIMVWGFTSLWVQKQGTDLSVTLMMVGALIMWQACYRANLDVSFNILDELWSRNLVNLFSTPLTVVEWMSALMLQGLINSAVAISFASISAWILYGVTIFSLGWLSFACILLLLLSGWSTGLFTGACLIYWGQRVRKLVWVMGWFFVPLCGVFYPIAVVPFIVKCIAYALPMTYVFEAFRAYVTTGQIQYHYLAMSLALNIFYVTVMLLLFMYAFKHTKTKGLARLQAE